MTIEDEISRELSKKIDAMMREAICGPLRKQPQTALVIEPAPRCCYGTILHAPNCKHWLT